VHRFFFLVMDSMNKKEVISGFRVHETDTGSAEVQVALLTERINHLNKHFETAPRDFASRTGLMKMVGRRRRFLDYLKSKNFAHYEGLVQRLGLRK
jgi:small subunit ribosomal protein S15